MIKEQVIATTNPDLETPLTEENLQEFADTCTGCPVLINFDPYHPIGKVCSAKVEDGKLLATIKVTDECAEDIKSFVPCTGYTSDVSLEEPFGSKYKISNIKAQCVGIVVKADDPTIPPIK